jgi:hypothetical protein
MSGNKEGDKRNSDAKGRGRGRSGNKMNTISTDNVTKGKGACDAL